MNECCSLRCTGTCRRRIRYQFKGRCPLWTWHGVHTSSGVWFVLTKVSRPDTVSTHPPSVLVSGLVIVFVHPLECVVLGKFPDLTRCSFILRSVVCAHRVSEQRRFGGVLVRRSVLIAKGDWSVRLQAHLDLCGASTSTRRRRKAFYPVRSAVHLSGCSRQLDTQELTKASAGQRREVGFLALDDGPPPLVSRRGRSASLLHLQYRTGGWPILPGEFVPLQEVCAVSTKAKLYLQSFEGVYQRCAVGCQLP
ncbi:hypothetical protein BDV95DRAFT_211689 [Massariosphaeria phaeospora]|uniref:Uncharacterized protein n=1 Tax=Massariosphaeria phaeospora TaxID=100035 RepID=A0A7C8MCP8_9PLEO|nr:hypothetical protein BDV95DRAFT_211689 [Massariosphaeria phaeospora]